MFGDGSAADHAAGVALDHNFLPLLVATGIVAYKAYGFYANVALLKDLADTYRDEGAEAAAEKAVVYTALTLAVGAAGKKLAPHAVKLFHHGNRVFTRLGSRLVELSRPGLRALAQSPLGKSFFKSGVKVVGSTGDMRWATTVAHYIRDMEVRSGFRFMSPQKTALANALRTGTFKKLGSAARQGHTDQFTKATRGRLIAEWERNTGQAWPRMRIANSRTGVVELKPVQAHHIIPQQVGGPHQWWNMKPIHPSQHQGGLHGSGSPLNRITKQLE